MKAQRKRWYTGVVILGGVALLVDRLLLSEGSADSAIAFSSGVAPEQPVIDEDVGVSIPALAFPRGIRPWDSSTALPDLFDPRRSDPQRAGEVDAGGRSGIAGHKAFASKHTLSAILADSDLRIAIVDGQWLRIGESLQGCTLREISGRQARFECHDGGAVLELVTGLRAPGDR